MLHVDLSFPHDYEVSEPDEFPGSGSPSFPIHYIPSATRRPERDGLWLKITPHEHEPWVGVFGMEGSWGPGVTGVYSTPQPNRVCVVSSGLAYFVRADDPASWEFSILNFVRDVRSIPDRQMLVLADLSGLAAYGPNGLLWRTQGLGDYLEIKAVLSDRIEGTVYEPMEGCRVPFAIDLATGEPTRP